MDGGWGGGLGVGEGCWTKWAAKRLHAKRSSALPLKLQQSLAEAYADDDDFLS